MEAKCHSRYSASARQCLVFHHLEFAIWEAPAAGVGALRGSATWLWLPHGLSLPSLKLQLHMEGQACTM